MVAEAIYDLLVEGTTEYHDARFAVSTDHGILPTEGRGIAPDSFRDH